MAVMVVLVLVLLLRLIQRWTALPALLDLDRVDNNMMLMTVVMLVGKVCCVSGDARRIGRAGAGAGAGARARGSTCGGGGDSSDCPLVCFAVVSVCVCDGSSRFHRRRRRRPPCCYRCCSFLSLRVMATKE